VLQHTPAPEAPSPPLLVGPARAWVVFVQPRILCIFCFNLQVTPDSLRAELIPTDATNLVMRALQLFADRVPTAVAVHCRLHKRIPAQGEIVV